MSAKRFGIGGKNGGGTHIINVMKDITPKRIKNRRRNQKSAYAHPQTVRKCRKGQSDDEVRKKRGHEHDEGFAREQVEEEPHDPHEEGRCIGAEVGEKVCNQGEEERDENCMTLEQEAGTASERIREGVKTYTDRERR